MTGADSDAQVVVLDYGSGNVRSVVRALERAGARVDLSADPDAVTGAEGLVVPGVGAFAAVMSALHSAGAPQLISRRLAAGRPVLGICVGMQVMFSQGVEHGQPAAGLGHWPGQITRLAAPVVPHMGWSTIQPPPNSELFRGLATERFYFVHSYAAHQAPDHVQTTWSEHGHPFVAAVQDGPLTATQFHPEKSGEAGARLLANWLSTLRRGKK